MCKVNAGTLGRLVAVHDVCITKGPRKELRGRRRRAHFRSTAKNRSQLFGGTKESKKLLCEVAFFAVVAARNYLLCGVSRPGGPLHLRHEFTSVGHLLTGGARDDGRCPACGGRTVRGDAHHAQGGRQLLLLRRLVLHGHHHLHPALRVRGGQGADLRQRPDELRRRLGRHRRGCGRRRGGGCGCSRRRCSGCSELLGREGELLRLGGRVLGRQEGRAAVLHDRRAGVGGGAEGRGGGRLEEGGGRLRLRGTVQGLQPLDQVVRRVLVGVHGWGVGGALAAGGQQRLLQLGRQVDGGHGRRLRLAEHLQRENRHNRHASRLATQKWGRSGVQSRIDT